MFRIDWNLIDDMTVTQLKRIFSHFIVVKCEDDGMRREKIYTCYSHLFRSVCRGFRVPEYRIIVEQRYDEDKHGKAIRLPDKITVEEVK